MRTTNDTFFIPERRARSEAAKAVVSAVQGRLSQLEAASNARRRRRKTKDQLRHNLMVEAIVCEAIRCRLIHPEAAVAVSLGRERGSRYEPAPYGPMKALLSALGPDGLGLLNVRWGSKQEPGKRGLRTVFEPSEALRDQARHLSFADFGRRPGGEPIVLRQAKRSVAQHDSPEVADWFEIWAQTGAGVEDLVPYEDSDAAQQLRADLNHINAALDAADLSLASCADAAQIDIGDRGLRRMFNNGHSDFRHGGRLAGGFWMAMPKQLRIGAIRIDGHPVAELDYRAMMPRLLYASVGRPFPPDKDPYSICGIPPQHREGVKTLCSALLFGPTALKRWPRGCKSKFPKWMRHKEALELMRREHQHVAHKFGSFMGFELLRTESDILVGLLGRCLDRGIIVLPIHDAVLCPVHRADEVEMLMREVFEERTGAATAVSISAVDDEKLSSTTLKDLEKVP